ncbi:Gamma-tubulin complex component 2, partial [Globisporangium splendens]
MAPPARADGDERDASSSRYPQASASRSAVVDDLLASRGAGRSSSSSSGAAPSYPQQQQFRSSAATVATASVASSFSSANDPMARYTSAPPTGLYVDTSIAAGGSRVVEGGGEYATPASTVASSEDPLTPRSRLALNSTLTKMSASGNSQVAALGLDMSGIDVRTNPSGFNTSKLGAGSHPLSPHKALLHLLDSADFKDMSKFGVTGTSSKGSTPLSSHHAISSFAGRSMASGFSSESAGVSSISTQSTLPRVNAGGVDNPKESSRCGTEILYNSLIRLRLNNHQCLRISALSLSPPPVSSSSSTPSSKKSRRAAPKNLFSQIDVSGNGLNGDDDQVFVLLNGSMRTDCGEVHYSDIVALYCVSGSRKGHFLSVDPMTQQLTTKKGPVISNGEKWRLVNPNVAPDAREEEGLFGETSTFGGFAMSSAAIPGRPESSFFSVNSTNILWEQQKTIVTSDKVLFKMYSADMFLTARTDPYDLLAPPTLELSKENDESNNCLQVWEITKSNIPYDPSWNRERGYLTGEVFVQPHKKRREAVDANDVNLPPLSSYPPSAQESIIIDDLLYAFVGVAGRYIKLEVTETRINVAKKSRTFKFSLDQYGMDPSISSLAGRCFCLGEYYLKLTLYVEQFSRYEYGQVNHAFCAALKSLLKEYTIVIAQLEHQMKAAVASGQAPMTIQKLWYYLQPSLRTMEMLSMLIDACRNTLGGGSLLSEIQRIRSSLAGDMKAGQVFSFLMERATVPYLKMVERWIYHGDLVDPYDEFMIRRDDEVSKEDVSDNPYSTYWQDRYTLREAQVPLFLARFAQKILTAGKYLNVFRTCNRQVDCPFAGTIEFAPSESVYEELIDKAHSFASQTLLDLFVKDNDLANRLNSLKHYFLMDQGDFFVDFMDVAEEELKLRADKLSLSRLESLLHLSLQTSTCSSDPYKDDLVCFLSPNNLISQMEAIHERAQKGPRDSLTTFSSTSMKHPGPSFCLRQRMLHFQQNFVYYMMFEVISPRWHDFQKQLTTVETVDDILDYHGEFLDICMKECLLTDPDLLRVLTKLMTVCMTFANSIECFTRPYFLDEETIKAEREAERDRRAEKKAREEAEAALASYQRLNGGTGPGGAGKKRVGVLKRRQSSQVDMRRARIKELSDDVKRALTEREGDMENPFVRMTSDLENQFDSLLGEFMQQLLRRSLLQIAAKRVKAIRSGNPRREEAKIQRRQVRFLKLVSVFSEDICARADTNMFETHGGLCRAFASFIFLLSCLVCDIVVANQLTVLVQPINSVAGEPLSLQPVVALTDDDGNILTSINSGTVRASVGVNPARFATVQPTNNAFTFVNGIAKCTDLYINMAGSGYTIVLISLSHGYGIWWYCVFAAAIVDKGGNRVDTLYEGTVRLGIVKNPVGGRLLPAENLNVTIGGGLAKFQGTYIDVAGSPYTLRYTTDLVLPGGSEVETNPFTVAAGVCNNLVLLNTPVEATGGKTFAIQPVLKLVDSGGNTLEEDSSSMQNLSDGVLDGQSNEHQPILALLDAGGNVASSILTGSVTARLIPSAGIASSIVVDTSVAPLITVVSVKALPTPLYPMPYGVGMRLSIEVTFSDEVLVLGMPTLTLATSTTGLNGVAECVTLNTWTTKVVFQYDVVLTDSSSDLNYLSTSALSLNGGTIQDRNMRTPTLTLPDLASAQSLAGTSNVVIDTTAPVLLSVSSTTPGDGEYGTGEEIYLKMLFSHPVTVYGNPLLPLALTTIGNGALTWNAVFSSGNNTDTLVFLYVVQSGDATATVLDVTVNVNTNGGFIKHYSSRPTTDVIPTMVTAPSNLASLNSIAIDTSIPTVDPTIGVTSLTGNGVYAPGDGIEIVVTFTKPVTTGNAHLIYQDDNALDLNGGSIKRYIQRGSGAANAVLSLAAATAQGKSLKDNAQIDLDGLPPTVLALSIVSAPSGNIIRGDAVTIGISFSSRVIVDTTRGVPSLQLYVGEYNRQAIYTSGSGTLALLFTYQVKLGDRVPDGLDYRSSKATLLNLGAIRRASMTPILDADLTLPDPTLTLATPPVLVDPTVGFVTTIQSIVADAPAGECGSNHVITLTVKFTDEVAVDGITLPVLKMNTNAFVEYVSGSQTDELVFIYIVQRVDCFDYQQLAEEFFIVRLNVPGGEPLIGEQYIARVRIDDDDFAYEPC